MGFRFSKRIWPLLASVILASLCGCISTNYYTYSGGNMEGASA
jgi:hypothetical protein